MHHRLSVLALAVALGLAVTSAPAASAQQPALTAQTLNSGGTMPAEQARVHFDHAELHFTVDAANQSLDASATLTFTAKSAADVLLLDLDRNLPISGIDLDGHALATGAWSNPGGRLTHPPALAARRRRQGASRRFATAASRTWRRTRAVGRRLRLGEHRGRPARGSPPPSRARAATCSGRASTTRLGEPDLVDLHITVPEALSAPANGVLVGIDRRRTAGTPGTGAPSIPNTYAIALNVGAL